MKGANPFTYIESLSSSKRHLLRNTDNDEAAEKSYVAFLTNRNFSFFPDTLGDANIMNRLWQLPGRLQYDYYFHSLRPRKRFTGKWAKTIKNTDIEAVMECFQYGYRRAVETLRILTPSQLKDVHAALGKGGKP